MPARLRVYPPGLPARDILLQGGRGYRVGRDPAADIHIDDSRVSRRHLEIDAGDRPWRVVELGSKNGTLLDGVPLESARLPDHAWLSIGGITAEFRMLDAIDAARIETEIRQRRDTTLKLSRRLDPAAPEPDLLEAALDAFLALAGCPAGALLLLTGDGRLDTRRVCGDAVFSGSRRVLRDVVETGRPQVSCDVAVEAALAARDSIRAGGVRALVCLPLVLGRRTVGALYAHSRAPGKAFTELDLELLKSIAGQAAFALGVAQVRDQLAELGSDLPLTHAELERDPELLRLLEHRFPAYPAS